MIKHTTFLFYILTLLILTSAKNSQAQTVAPKREVRAAWLTSVYGLDWPRNKATSDEGRRRQKEELLDILDKLKDANFNTVLFQVRTRGEVLYKSAYEPYCSILTGKSGADPGYDPLAFVVEECHKRGMECHAWIVALPLGKKQHVHSLGKASVRVKKPSICVAYKNEYFLNPASPKTKAYLMDLTREIVSNYDVDGVQYDYLRYPEKSVNFPDRNEYKRQKVTTDISTWRKGNITEIVRYIYNGVKKLKPWVKVSTSPVGKLDDTTRYSSKGWNATEVVKQDVGRWLKEGIQDQIYPMMYFRDDAFYPFALDWHEQCNGRQVIPGLGIYFLDPKEGDWRTDDIQRQIYFLRQNGLDGQAHYRVRYLTENTQGLYDILADNFYNTPALVPPMKWMTTDIPSAPESLDVTTDTDGCAHLTWDKVGGKEKDGGMLYTIYGSDTYPVDTENSANIVAINIRENSYNYNPLLPWARKRFFAVTAIDRYGNESEPIQQKR